MNQPSVDGRIIQRAIDHHADQLGKDGRHQAKLNRFQDPTGRRSIDLPLIKHEELIALENIQVELHPYGQNIPFQVLRNMRNDQLHLLIDAVSELIRYHEGHPEESFPEGKQTFVGQERLALEQLRQVMNGDKPECQQNHSVLKRPGRFIGFCIQKIEEMEPSRRDAFLDINSGKSTFFMLPEKWHEEWVSRGNKTFSKPQQGISKAKKWFRENMNN